MERCLFLLLISIILFPLLAFSQEEETPKLVGTMQVYKLEWNDEGVSMIPYNDSTKVTPGDTLYYELRYENVGTGDAIDNEIVTPISEGCVFVPNSVTGENLELLVSLNHGEVFSKPPVELKTKTEDGEEVIEIATPEMYTHLKFKVNKVLKPGDSTKVGFKEIIIQK
ncbi:hypothetical protein JXI42_06155 [bacterium]|nr:hypothetical protein [bacterium]